MNAHTVMSDKGLNASMLQHDILKVISDVGYYRGTLLVQYVIRNSALTAVIERLGGSVTNMASRPARSL
jgi:hypothetical protein